MAGGGSFSFFEIMQISLFAVISLDKCLLISSCLLFCFVIGHKLFFYVFLVSFFIAFHKFKNRFISS